MTRTGARLRSLLRSVPDLRVLWIYGPNIHPPVFWLYEFDWVPGTNDGMMRVGPRRDLWLKVTPRHFLVVTRQRR